MHCDHQLIQSKLFDYLEQKTSPEQNQTIEQTLSRCAYCEQLFQQARQLKVAANAWHDQAVPEWHRTSFAIRPSQPGLHWLSWGALATSTLALVMLILQVQISHTPQGLHLAFGGVNQAQIDAQIEQRLMEFREQQNLLLDARLVSENDKQINANQTLMLTILDKVRDERRDDLHFIVSGLQTQRFEDQSKAQTRYALLTENQIENNRYINQLLKSTQLSQGE